MTAQSLPRAATPAVARLAFTLAGVSGYVDAVGATFLKGLYVSFMSGNTTSAGMALGQGQWDKALHAGLPVPLYIAGVFFGSLALLRWPKGRPWLYALIAALLGSFAILARLTDITVGWAGLLALALLTVPMGALNASLQHVGATSVGLGYITGTLANLGEHLAKRVAHKLPSPGQPPQVRLYAGLWLTFFLGAGLGGFGAHRFSSWALLLPMLALLLELSLNKTVTEADV